MTPEAGLREGAERDERGGLRGSAGRTPRTDGRGDAARLFVGTYTKGTASEGIYTLAFDAKARRLAVERTTRTLANPSFLVPWGALVCAAMDARRSQIYNALFEIRGGKPVRLCEDRAISLAELGEELGKMQKSAFLVGDGAQLCYNTCLDMGIPAVLAPGNLVSQSAWGVAMAAFGQTPAPAEELLPVYLRLSQAERERQARLAAQAAQE